MSLALPPSQLELQAAAVVADAIGRSPRVVRWRDDVPIAGRRALVIHAPWARVVAAVSAFGAKRLAQDPKRRAILRDSLYEQYPTELTDWCDSVELEQVLLEPRERRFCTWATSSAGRRQLWPLVREGDAAYGVVGSWGTWADAVLEVRADADGVLFRLRRGRWVKPPPQPAPPAPR